MPAPPVNALAHGASEGRLRPGADPGLDVRSDVRRVDDAEGRRQRPPAREGRAALRGVAHHACADPGERLPLAEQSGVEGPFARRLDRRKLRVPIGPGEGRQHDERRRRADREPGTPPPRHHPSPPLKGEPPAPRPATASAPGHIELEAQVLRRPELVRLGADRPVAPAEHAVPRPHRAPHQAVEGEPVDVSLADAVAPQSETGEAVVALAAGEVELPASSLVERLAVLPVAFRVPPRCPPSWASRATGR